eukprot:scaffold651191_cov50-Prasinocladus_malaysianus.AAC.1
MAGGPGLGGAQTVWTARRPAVTSLARTRRPARGQARSICCRSSASFTPGQRTTTQSTRCRTHEQ